MKMVAVGSKHHQAAKVQQGILRQDGKLQHHLVHLCVTVAANAENLPPHRSEHSGKPLWVVSRGQIVPGAMV